MSEKEEEEEMKEVKKVKEEVKEEEEENEVKEEEVKEKGKEEKEEEGTDLKAQSVETCDDEMHIVISTDQPLEHRLSLKQLRALCSANSLSIVGKKSDLAARLVEAKVKIDPFTDSV